MSRPADPTPVKLVMSFISSDEALVLKSLERTAGRFGEIDFLSRYLSFEYTDYYEGEMGARLKRRFASFQDLMDPESLPDIKCFTNEIEEEFASGGKRRVNIDPGYLTEFHLILATGKRYAHRPYLRRGIYADLTLIYRDRSFQSLEWTYPDYAGPEMKVILNKIRNKYLKQLKTERP